MNKLHLKKKTTIFISALLMPALFIFAGCGEQEVREEAETVFTEEDRVDMGRQPWVLDIEEATIASPDYRNTRWTGEYMQMVFMSLKPGEIIDLEVHNDHDQFIRIEQGEARVLMGKTRDNLDFDKQVSDDWAVLIPAGYWHQVTNTGNVDLKLYTIYAPPEHPEGTNHRTYEEAEEYEHSHEH